MKNPKLTVDQKRIMLALCNAAERHRSIRLEQSRKVRDGATGAALVRKGLAKRLPCGRFEATNEGYWLGDGLRIEKRIREAKEL